MLSQPQPQPHEMAAPVMNTRCKACKLRASIDLLTAEAPTIELTILGKINLPPVRKERPGTRRKTLADRLLHTAGRARKLRAAISLLTSEAPRIELTIVGKIDLPKARNRKTAIDHGAAKASGSPLQIPDRRQLSHGSRHILRSYMEQQGRCFYCQSPMTLHNKGQWRTRWEDATVEHLYPRGDLRRYLLNDQQCTVIACHRCNAEKNHQFLHRRYHYDEILRMPVLINLIPSFATGRTG